MAAKRARPLRPRAGFRSLSCRGSTSLGDCDIRSWPRLVFGNAITSRIDSVAADEHDEAIEPDRDAAVGRRAEAEGAQEMAELLC